MDVNGREVDLVALCLAINAKQHPVSEVDVALAEEAAIVLRRTRRRFAEDTAPPAVTARDLSHVGWLIYVASWEILQTVPTDWSRVEGDRRVAATTGMALLLRLDGAARLLPWPEYAPRALGAYRTHALGLSKEDTVESYREAWNLHAQADDQYTTFLTKVKADATLTRALREVQVQLQLAETGTSCREPEQIVTAWPVPERPADAHGDEEDAFLRMFHGLEKGTVHGTESIALLDRLDEESPLGWVVDEFHLLTRSNYRNPGIMTARAHLIMLPMTAVLQAWDQPPLRGHDSWDAARDHLVERAVAACAIVEQEMGEAFRPDHVRQVVQLRLMLAFLGDGIDLPTRISELAGLPSILDLAAVPALSDWLTDGQHDGGIISSAIMPSYVAGLRLVTADERWGRYVDWREEHIALDRQVRNGADPLARLAEFRRAVDRSYTVI